ncbi:MAG: DNA polymerase III subunit delta [Marinovum algicola]|uniref:DNA-directed DNA polymerase n=1 Tax=Marinovum algicola TaxID=42444 RepID=A0A975WC21_9RHOB|nr:DNA polymerase III subunit delta [Marinovum algicola]SEJ85685.1 DNA polymerase III, delta subunit [Marinovum algicola]SLN67867.1 DNA polymerase III subunit delta [Marinovum algicola]
MKLSPREAPGYFAKPDPRRTGLLIYGPDGMRVALKRQEVIAALIGPEGEAEMRLSRIPGGDLRKEPTLLIDAVKAIGFFPGPRVAFVEEATDVAAPAILAALEDWAEGDAQIVVTAGQLKATSKIRKAFEAHPNAYAAAIYDDPPSRAEIEAELNRAGVTVGGAAMEDITTLSRALDPGDFRQTLEKLALYKHGDSSAVTPEDVAAVAPASTEAELDDVLNIVAEAKTREIGPMLSRLAAQGTQPVGLVIAAMRHFRALHAAASHPDGAARGIAAMRPPIFGPRRDRMTRQASAWGAHRLDQAISLLTDTDLQLRSAGQNAPAMALVERMLIRLAMLGASR